MDKLMKILKDTTCKNVKVGAKDGSGFFYAGTVNNFIENFDMIDKACKKEAKDTANRRKEELDKLCSSAPTPEMWARKCVARDNLDDLNCARYEQNLGRHFHKIAHAAEAAKLAKDRNKYYAKLGSRNVIDCYASNMDEDCVIIIVEGYEVGKYWTLDEAPEGQAVCFDISEPENDEANNNEEQVA